MLLSTLKNITRKSIRSKTNKVISNNCNIISTFSTERTFEDAPPLIIRNGTVVNHDAISCLRFTFKTYLDAKYGCMVIMISFNRYDIVVLCITTHLREHYIHLSNSCFIFFIFKLGTNNMKYFIPTIFLQYWNKENYLYQLTSSLHE